MRFLSIILVVLGLHGLSSMASGQGLESDISNEDREAAAIVVAAYDKHTSSLNQYVAGCSAAITIEDFGKHQTYSYDAKYSTCYDRKQSLLRYDSLTPKFSVDSLKETIQEESTVVSKSGAKWFTRGRTNGSLEFDSLPKDGPPLLSRMVMIEPAYIPAWGYMQLMERRPTEPVYGALKPYAVVKFQDDVRLIGLELEVSKSDGIYAQMVFDKSQNNLLIESRLLRRVTTKDGKVLSGEMAITKTKWGTFNSTRVPIQILTVQNVGPPKEGTKQTWDLSINWRNLPIDEKGIPVAFDSDNNGLRMSPRAIIEYGATKDVRAGK